MSSDLPLLLFYGDEQGSLQGREHVAMLRLSGVLDGVLGRRTLVSDLNEANLMLFLQALEASGIKPESVRRSRAALRAIWKLAVERGLVAAPPHVARFLTHALPAEPDQCIPDGKTSLLQAAEAMFGVRVNIRSDQTRYQYRLCIRDYGIFLGRIATLDDLTDDLVSAWMGSMLDGARSTNTVRERTGRIQSLWVWLAKRGEIRKWPTIIKPPPVDPLPTALSEEQLRRLFTSAAKERGNVGGVPAPIWWVSFLAFVWNTSERKSAALSMRIEWFDLENVLCKIPPHVRKGGRKWGIYDLWPETIPLLQACIASDPNRELMWPWPKCAGSYYTSYNRILRGAGIPATRKMKTHGLRCSHATWLKVAGGNPTAQLGHGDEATTIRHYLDPTKFRQKQPKLFIPWDGKKAAT